MKKALLFFTFLLLNIFPVANANNVTILAAAIFHQSHGEYLVNVKLQHQDNGWEHYADEWRLVDAQGNILGSRVLLHPHVEEQPFTRALSNVKLDDSLGTIYVEAHDKEHGWSKQKLEIDLSKMQGGKLIVKANQ
jgi:hypothetical protein